MTGLGKKEEEENKIKQTHASCITDITCRSCERQFGSLGVCVLCDCL